MIKLLCDFSNLGFCICGTPNVLWLFTTERNKHRPEISEIVRAYHIDTIWLIDFANISADDPLFTPKSIDALLALKKHL